MADDSPAGNPRVPAHRYTGPEGLLAHYTRASVAFEHVMTGRRLRLSPYRDMRDPAENKDLLPAMGWYGERPNAEAAWAEAVEQIKFFRDCARILSLTEDAADRDGVSHGTFECSWARPRMWEQYADVHAGVCLVFDGARLRATLREELARQPGPFYLRSVRYTPEGIAGSSSLRTLVDDRLFDDEQRYQAVSQLVHERHEDFFFLKSSDWATEHEFRAVMLHREDGYTYVDYGGALEAVILGERFPSWQVAGARALCEAAGVELRRIVWDKGRPLALRVLQDPVFRLPASR